jgi:hypothetical protein
LAVIGDAMEGVEDHVYVQNVPAGTFKRFYRKAGSAMRFCDDTANVPTGTYRLNVPPERFVSAFLYVHIDKYYASK